MFQAANELIHRFKLKGHDASLTEYGNSALHAELAA